ncbi:hypothetical protein GGR56DRAFT_674131 [Xylariaceae sp. FL0804]|nr:hypothetical protein GGR56DRAFT_674131 [Xylariaceae sp. FL0804]
MSTYDSSSGYGSSSGVDNAAGGSGSSPGSVDISRGGIIAIIVVVVVVGVFGISMAVLFYLTKKKEWKLRERVGEGLNCQINAWPTHQA